MIDSLLTLLTLLNVQNYFFKPNQKLAHTFALVSLDHPVVKIGQAGEAGASKPMKTNTTVRAKCRIGVGLSVGLGVWNTPFSKDLLKASVKLFYTFSYSRKRTLLASTYSYTVICILLKWNCCTILNCITFPLFIYRQRLEIMLSLGLITVLFHYLIKPGYRYDQLNQLLSIYLWLSRYGSDKKRSKL